MRGVRPPTKVPQAFGAQGFHSSDGGEDKRRRKVKMRLGLRRPPAPFDIHQHFLPSSPSQLLSWERVKPTAWKENSSGCHAGGRKKQNSPLIWRLPAC